MPGYKPPITSMPFVFTNKGYVKPVYSPLSFKFGGATSNDLKAAINVMLSAPYKEKAHTYLKGCPRYVIGYKNYGIQIIQGNCVYGGIRDLQVYITPITTDNIIANLPAVISRVFPRDLPVALTINPPKDIFGYIKGVVKEDRFIQANIHAWDIKYLSAVVEGTHDPINISAFVRVKAHGYGILPTKIHAWQVRYLSANVEVFQYNNLSAVLEPIPAIHLAAYLKIWPQEALEAHIRGWGDKNLSAIIKQVFKSDLYAYVNPVNNKIDLITRIKGIGNGQVDLYSGITGFTYKYLNASVRATYLNNITAYLFPVVPKYIKASVHAWHIGSIQGILNIAKYPYDISAYINASGSWKLLSAEIYPKQGINIYGELKATIHSWYCKNFPASIFPERPGILNAYINSQGNSINLHASIYPKMIRLTTLVNIPTMEHGNLSATINYLCFNTGYSNLSGHIYSVYKGDLQGYIKAIRYNYKPTLLGATAGYADTYSEVDKLKLSITIYPSSIITESKLRIKYMIYNSRSLLGAYIKGTLRYRDLSASITANSIDSYSYDGAFKNREKVINRTYDGIFKSYEVVEMAFKSIVNDYYYSSEGGVAWKSNRFDKWALELKSYIPTNLSLNIKRKLHKVINLYDIRGFSSVDEAIKFAISYVTNYPQAGIGASIYGNGAAAMIGASISPVYIKNSKIALGATISATAGYRIITSSDGKIIKV